MEGAGPAGRRRFPGFFASDLFHCFNAFGSSHPPVRGRNGSRLLRVFHAQS
jgi:hypothetical protein